MGILQTVFELTNVEGVKVLTILGMKFKLKKKNTKLLFGVTAKS